MNLFVTGTDTDVGKTIVSSWICLKTQFKYWKPIQTGFDSDSSKILELSEKTFIIPNVYKLKAPLSPFDSANLENILINIDNITQKNVEKTVIEGAGGALVPIAENFFIADLINKFNSKAIIVAKSKLGFLNHIFLTVEALRGRKIDILGVIINGKTDELLIKTIEKFAKIKVIKVLPFFENIKSELQKIELPNEIAECLK